MVSYIPGTADRGTHTTVTRDIIAAPDTDRNHQDNLNRYSVLGASAWKSLIERTNFIIDQQMRIKPPGDEYYAFFLTRLAIGGYAATLME